MKILATVLLSNVLAALLVMSGCRSEETTAEVKKIVTRASAPRLIQQLTRVGLSAEQLTLVRSWVAKARGKAYGHGHGGLIPEVGIRTILEEAGFAGRVDIVETLVAANTLGAKEFVSTAAEQAALAGNEKAVDHLLTLYEVDIDVNKVVLAAARGNHLPLVQRVSTLVPSESDQFNSSNLSFFRIWYYVAEEAGFNGSTAMIGFAKKKGDNDYGGISSSAVEGAVKGGHLTIVKREFSEIDSTIFEESPRRYMIDAAKYGHPDIMEYISDQSGGSIPLETAEIAAREGHINVLNFLNEKDVFKLEEDNKNYETVVNTLFRSLFYIAFRGNSADIDYMIDLITSHNFNIEKNFSLRAILKEELRDNYPADDEINELIIDDIVDSSLDDITDNINFTNIVIRIAKKGGVAGDQPHVVDDMINRLSDGIQVDERAFEMSRLPHDVDQTLLDATRYGSKNTVMHLLNKYAVQASDAEIFQEVRELADIAGHGNIVSIVDRYIANIEKVINRVKKLIEIDSPFNLVFSNIKNIVERKYQISPQDANLILNYAVEEATSKSKLIGFSDEKEILEVIDHAIKLGAKDFNAALQQAKDAGHTDIVARLKQASKAYLMGELKSVDIPKI